MCVPSQKAAALVFLVALATVALTMLAGPLASLFLLYGAVQMVSTSYRISVAASHMQHTAAANFIRASYFAS
jgi:hypothetical protein